GEPAVDPSANGWDYIAAIDGGRDFEYKSFFAHGDTSSWQIRVGDVTKTLTNTPNYFTPDFRFRFRLKAKNDAPLVSLSRDDADPWYIDNPTLLPPRLPDIETRWV